MSSRQFTIDGVKFALNLKPRNGFNAKYSLLYYNDFYGAYVQICGADTIKDARKLARRWMKYGYI